VLISFVGANYGILDDTPKARLGGSGCESTQWVSERERVGELVSE